MTNSKHLAGLIGPSAIAITISETLNVHIWAANTAACIHLNGTLLFIAGLSIIRAHNHWIGSWPILITIVGWFTIFLGLFRMFAPDVQLQSAQNTPMVITFAMIVLSAGVFLTFKAYRK